MKLLIENQTKEADEFIGKIKKRKNHLSNLLR